MGAATQKSIAQELGISPSTVSRALSNDPRISLATRLRVAEAAKRLGYQPNLLAAGFRTGSSMSIGLIVLDITDPFYSHVARGVEDQAYGKGYSVILCDSDASTEREALYLQLMRNKRVDGVLITPVSEEIGARQELVDQGTPYVLIDALECPDDTSSVAIDHEKGASIAIEHLIACGHSRIGLFGGHLEIPSVRARFMGYKKTMSEAGLKWDRNWIREDALTMETAYLAMCEVLESGARLTSALFNSDLTAIAAKQALEERGMRIPDDFSLIGYDDVPMAARVTPPLTTVSQDKYQLGAISARILMHEIETRSESMHQKVVLQPKLILRGSSGPLASH